MQFCSHCGGSVQDATRFCPKCGKPVASIGAGPRAGTSASPPPSKVVSSLAACRYHPQAGFAGNCVDCHSSFCQECAVEIVRHGTVCLDCGTRFARKKLTQAYVAVGLGVFAGLAMASSLASEGNWAFAIGAPIIYGYLFGAIFFGWHYGGRIWTGLASMVDRARGSGALVGGILLLSFRLMVAMTIGVFGGGIVQYLRYRRMVDLQRSLASPSRAQVTSA